MMPDDATAQMTRTGAVAIGASSSSLPVHAEAGLALDDSSGMLLPGAFPMDGVDAMILHRSGTIQVGDSLRNLVTNGNSNIPSGDNEILIHARLVEEERLLEQQQQQQQNEEHILRAKRDPWWRRNQWWLAGVAMVLAITIVLSMVLTLTSGESPKAPTMAPTTLQEGFEDQLIKLVTSEFPASTAAISSKDVSPQSRALEWMADQSLRDDESSIMFDSLSTESTLQLFSLATLYFSTGGESSWLNTKGWMISNTTSSKCEWFGVECNADGAVQNLSLSGNMLNGTLPPEMSILSSGLEVLNLSSNNLVGPVPSEIGSMTVRSHISCVESQSACSEYSVDHRKTEQPLEL
jgi:hypothetical protein